jgi:UDP-glucose:(heptosyl)LPS alpha-1,3-glucosyltransferase
MKIAIVTDTFDPLFGGLEQWTFQLTRHLHDAGHDVHVVAFTQANHNLPVTVHILPASTSQLTRAKRIEQHLAFIRPDIVHDTGASWSGDVFQPQTGSRLLSLDREIASYDPLRKLRVALSPKIQWRRRTTAWIERRQAARAHHLIAVSRRIRDYFTQHYAIPAQRISLMTNGVDTTTRFHPARIAQFRQPERDRLKIGDATMFLAGAHNLRLKGIDTALHATAALIRRGHDVRLVIAGGTPGRFWHSLVARLGLSNKIHFCGQVREIEHLFAAADAVVHPTRWDACSLITMEAMACGVPMVTTAWNGMADIVQDGQNGFVLDDPDDAAALADRMERLVEPTLRHRIGAAARDLACRYDIRENCRAVESVLIATAAGIPLSTEAHKRPAISQPADPDRKHA